MQSFERSDGYAKSQMAFGERVQKSGWTFVVCREATGAPQERNRLNCGCACIFGEVNFQLSGVQDSLKVSRRSL